MGVSKNRDTPKWMVKIMENPIKNGWFGGILPHYFRKAIQIEMYSPRSQVPRFHIRLLVIWEAAVARSRSPTPPSLDVTFVAWDISWWHLRCRMPPWMGSSFQVAKLVFLVDVSCKVSSQDRFLIRSEDKDPQQHDFNMFFCFWFIWMLLPSAHTELLDAADVWLKLWLPDLQFWFVF